jgi:predicted dienelactone hydrolase
VTKHAAIFWPLCVLMVMLTAVPDGLAVEQPVAVQSVKIAGLQVAVWIPHRGTPGPWPIIIFSHGFYGCNTQVSFLMRSLAGVGYAVFAPAHRDMDCTDPSLFEQKSIESFAVPGSWTDTKFADRAHDIEHLLDELAKDPRYSGSHFDRKHVGLIGHSLGGYTVLSVAGAWPKLKDVRAKAVLALSPFALPFIRNKTLGGLDAPVMYQGGTRDGMTMFLKMPGGAYDQSPAPKYFVEFDHIGHRGWTDADVTQHEDIESYSVAFFDLYLKRKPFPAKLLKPYPGIDDLKIQK